MHTYTYSQLLDICTMCANTNTEIRMRANCLQGSGDHREITLKQKRGEIEEKCFILLNILNVRVEMRCNQDDPDVVYNIIQGGGLRARVSTY